MSIKQTFASRPRLFASVVGVGTFCIYATGFIGLVATVASGDFNERHAEASKLAFNVLQDTNRVLDTLHARFTASCDPDNLSRLRKLANDSNAVQSIGILDEADRVMCESALGVVDTGRRTTFQPDVSFVRKQHPIRISFSGPSPAAAPSRPTIVIHEAPFEVVLHPYLVDQIVASGFQVTGMVLPNGFVPIARATRVNPATSAFINDPAAWRRNDFHFDPTRLTFSGTTWLKPSPYVFHSERSLLDYRLFTPPILLVSSLVGLFLSGLAGVRVRQRFESWKDLTHRIAPLLQAENLRCKYQPIVNMQTGEVIGCEVLSRMVIDGQIVPPNEFIPALIQQGLTWKFDCMVIRKALDETVAHLPSDACFKLALNVFPQSVRAQDLHALISSHPAIKSHTGISINIEVIELEYTEEIIQQVHQLKEMGYKVSVDDFGTGYSNLGSISKLSPDYLKIDRSFVAALGTEAMNRLLPSIVQLANAAGAQIIAEGVEHAFQRDALLAMGIEVAQGYFFSMPVKMVEFAKHMDSSIGAPLNAAVSGA